MNTVIILAKRQPVLLLGRCGIAFLLALACSQAASSQALPGHALSSAAHAPWSHTVLSGAPWSDLHDQLRVDGLQWLDIHESAQRNVVFRTAMFESRHDAATVAQQLTQATGDVFSRVLMTTGQLVVSGLEKGRHWLLVVGPHHSGSHGYLSIMDYQLSPHVDAARGSVVFPDMIPVFSSVEGTGQDWVAHQVYRVSGSADDVRRKVHNVLREQGWETEPSPVIDTPWHAHRPGQQLTIMLVPRSWDQIIYARYLSSGRGQ